MGLTLESDKSRSLHHQVQQHTLFLPLAVDSNESRVASTVVYLALLRSVLALLNSEQGSMQEFNHYVAISIKYIVLSSFP